MSSKKLFCYLAAILAGLLIVLLTLEASYSTAALWAERTLGALLILGGMHFATQEINRERTR